MSEMLGLLRSLGEVSSSFLDSRFISKDNERINTSWLITFSAIQIHSSLKEIPQCENKGHTN